MSVTSAVARALWALVTQRADARPVAAIRMVIGLSAVARAYEASRIFALLYAPATIRLPYVSWIPELPASGVPLLLTVWVASALLFTIGWCTRLTGGLLAGILLYVVLLDEQTYSNHLYLMAILVTLLVLADAGATWSMDSRRRPNRVASAPGGHATAPAWPIWLLKVQVSVVYGFAALSKLNGEYVGGAVLASFWLTELRAVLPEALVQPVLSAISGTSILLEMFVALGLWSPRLRGAAIVAGVALHVGMVVALPAQVRLQLSIFAVEMLALYTLFFPLRVGAGAERKENAPERPATPAEPRAAHPLGPA